MEMLNYWDVHGWWFLLGMIFIPRITMLFFTAPIFGFWAWVGWIFTPYLLGAIYATTFYWDKNPVLVVFSWIMAFVGTSGECEMGRKGWSSWS